MPGISVGQHIRAATLNITLDRFLSNDGTTTIPPNGIEQVLTWPIITNLSGNVALSGSGNTTFTLLRTGLWILDLSTRTYFNTQPNNLDHFVWIYNRATSVQYAGQTYQSPVINAPIFNCFTVRQFPAGTVLETRIRNSTEQTCHLGQVADLCHFSLTWLQPY